MTDEKDPKKEDSQNNDNSKELKIKVETGNMEAVLKRMAEIEAENKRLQEEAKKAADEKANLAKTAEEKAKEKEKLEADLKKINEDKFVEKQKLIMDKVKTVVTDPAKIKEYEEKLKDPAALSGIEYSIDTMATVLAEGKKQHEELMAKEKADFEKKLAEKTGGSGSLPASLNGGEGSTGGGSKYEEFEGETIKEANANMVRELRKRSHSIDPEVSAKAKAQLEELMRKWGVAAKRNFDNQSQGLGELGPKSIKEQPSLRKITKMGGEAI